MTDTNDLSGRTEQNTPNEDEKFFKAVYDSVDTKATPKVKVLFVNKDSGEITEGKDEADLNKKLERQDAETGKVDGKSKEAADGTTDVTEEGREPPKAQPIPKAKEQTSEDLTKDGKPHKAKKPSVFDEAKLAADALDEESKAPFNALLDHTKSLEKELRDLKHKFKSDDGRVAAYQRQAEELRRQLAYLQAQPPKTEVSKTDGKAALKVSEDEVMDLIKSEPKLKELYDSDPGLAKFLAEREVLADKKSEQREVAKTEKTRTQNDQERYLATQGEIIRTNVPEIAEVLNHPWWRQWVNTAPPHIQRWVNSPHADEFLHAYTLYCNDVELFLKENPQAAGEVEEEEEVTPAPVVKQVVDTSEADRIKAARDKRVKANTGASSSAAQPKAAEFDEQEEFKRIYQSVPQWKR